ncbi:MAG: hypothetical protein AAGG11_18990 [Pseudomonadota bacterium]
MQHRPAGVQTIQRTPNLPRSPISWQCPRTRQPRELAVRYEHQTDRILARGDEFRFDLTEPVRLEPVVIPKPWGREIWYTGSEARGESRVHGSHGSLPLAAYAALAPDAITDGLPLVLLKILVSDSQPLQGELYLEVHREKAEAYLVTHIDRSAWPDGVAELRYGISAEARGRYPDDQAFRQALTTAALALEASPEDPQRRRALLAFISSVQIREGSRVRIEPGIPHGLPNGVRVVEFQTPTYERLILAASQPVVTQASWDCGAAVDAMNTSPTGSTGAAVETVSGEQPLARFRDFGARILRLDAQVSELTLPPTRGAVVALCSEGSVQLGTLTLTKEEAAIIPAAALRRQQRVRASTTEATCVIAGTDY